MEGFKVIAKYKEGLKIEAGSQFLNPKALGVLIHKDITSHAETVKHLP